MLIPLTIERCSSRSNIIGVSRATSVRAISAARSAGFARVFVPVGPGVERNAEPQVKIPITLLARGSGRQPQRKKAVARSAGFGYFQSPIPGVSLRSTPGFTLSPAPRALESPRYVMSKIFCGGGPGVSLRSTPGFMLSPAAAGWHSGQIQILV